MCYTVAYRKLDLHSIIFVNDILNNDSKGDLDGDSNVVVSDAINGDL